VAEIDLSWYAGKEVICTLVGGEILSGELKFLKKHHRPYCYVVDGYQFTQTGEGLSKPQIKSIQLKNPMIGIAQKHPNINLEDFEGQRCYVKWSDGVAAIGRNIVSTRAGYWGVPGNAHCSFQKDGTNPSYTLHVTEIYGEGAFDVTTKDTFDTPSDDVVKKATEALKDLTEEQIAKVLHALKN
jgi:hypothetical protein